MFVKYITMFVTCITCFCTHAIQMCSQLDVVGIYYANKTHLPASPLSLPPSFSF